ncbi:hypothetical protein ES703_121257 [subsurface metagenome]
MDQHKRKRKRMRQVTCCLPSNVLRCLDKEVKRIGRSRSSVMRMLLDFCLFTEDCLSGKRHQEQSRKVRLVHRQKQLNNKDIIKKFRAASHT